MLAPFCSSFGIKNRSGNTTTHRTAKKPTKITLATPRDRKSYENGAQGFPKGPPRDDPRTMFFSLLGLLGPRWDPDGPKTPPETPQDLQNHHFG